MALFSVLGSFLAGSLATLAYQYYQKHIKQSEDTTSSADSPFVSRTSRSLNLNRSTTNTTAITTTDGMSGVFIADLLHHLWHHMNVAICRTVKESVEPMFATMLPAPLNSLRFTKLSLGDVPLRIDGMRVHPVQINAFTKRPYLQLEMDVLWNGECSIALKADYIGSLGVKSIKFAGRLSVILSPLLDELPICAAVQYGFVSTPQLSLDFTGLANVADFSTIKNSIYSTVESILNDMMVLPHRMISKVADPPCSFLTMYHPPLAILRLRVVRGRGFRAEKRSLRRADVPDVYCTVRVGDVSTEKESPWRTTTCKNSLTPEWKDANSSSGDDDYEHCDFEVHDYNQVIYIECYDEDTGTYLDSDDELGVSQLTVGDLLLQPRHSTELELQTSPTSGKSTGAYITIQAQVVHISSTDLDSVDTAIAKVNKKGHTSTEAKSSSSSRTFCGLLTILVAQAHDVPNQPDASVVAAAAEEDDDDDDAEATAKTKAAQDEIAAAPPVFVRVKYGTKSKFCTPALSGCNNPAFDTAFRVPLTSEILQDVVNNDDDDGKTSFSPVCFTLLQGNPPADGDDEDAEKELMTLGSFEVSHDAILEAPNHTLSGKKHMAKTGGPSLEYCVSISGLKVPEAAVDPVTGQGFSAALTKNVTGDSVPTGTNMVRITVVKAWGFKVEKRGMKKRDVPDVYCQLRFGSSPQVWRTHTVKNSTTPEWGADANASKTFPMQHPDQVVQMDVLDEDTGTRDEDDALGSVRVAIGKLLLAGGHTNVELELHGKPTGAFVTLQCQVLEAAAAHVPAVSEPVVYGEKATASSSSSSREEPSLKEEVQAEPKLDTSSDDDDKKRTSKGSPVRLTVLKGWGFQAEKRRLKKDDIPDAYVKIQLLDSADKKNNKQVWTTSVIKDNVTPEWNESHVFYKMNDQAIVQVNVWDRDTGISDSDDDLGCVLISLDKLLSAAAGKDGLTLSLLDKDGKSNGSFLSLRCCAISEDEVESDGTSKVSRSSPTADDYSSMKPSPSIAAEQGIPSSTTGSTSKAGSTTDDEKATIKPSTTSSVEVTTQSIRIHDAGEPEFVEKMDSAAPKATTDEEQETQDKSLVSVTVVKGRGFQVQKFRMKKNDVPDVYVSLKFGTSKDFWRTSTIDNSLEPEWNESRQFSLPTFGQGETTISLDVYDKDSGRRDDDDFLGKASIAVSDLLVDGMMEVELQSEDGKPNGCFITLSCHKVKREPEEVHA